MKRIIICLSWYMIVSFSSANAFDNKYNSTDRLLDIFASTSLNNYRQQVITIQEHSFAAVYDTAHSWFIFYRPVSTSELPCKAVSKLGKVYKDYSIKRTVMFMDEDGNAFYYSELVKKDKHIIISLNNTGNIQLKQKPLYKNS